eukprot:TRINITY_DN1754_c0_g1_i1.p1 TRINITY_DN1754_c0_g1~~TRINITY_DN1754_c0_g1_i1.p1  ORF type:complete len:135 (+),score=5.75 TRINITY_DN1754_c0_g1_i1:238-642(+)
MAGLRARVRATPDCANPCTAPTLFKGIEFDKRPKQAVKAHWPAKTRITERPLNPVHRIGIFSEKVFNKGTGSSENIPNTAPTWNTLKNPNFLTIGKKIVICINIAVIPLIAPTALLLQKSHNLTSDPSCNCTVY